MLTEVRAEVGSEIVLFGLHPKPLERLRRLLSVPNEKYARAVRLKRHPGLEPPRLEAMVEMPDGSVHLPRGSIAIIRTALAKDDYRLRIDRDDRVHGAPLPAVGAPTLRPYQEEGIEKIQTHLQGLVVLPCGGGKTRLGVAAVARLARSTLIIVPSIDLADQWVKSLSDIGLAPGQIGGGERRWSRSLTVAVEDSLDTWLQQHPEEGKSFGLVVIDEVHHVASTTLQRILRHLPARWRIGLTATPFREDGKDPWIGWSLGSLLLERTTAELIDEGYLMPAEVEFIETGWSFRWTGSDLAEHAERKTQAMERLLATHPGRNERIALRMHAEAKQGETVLVLANRHEQTHLLTERLRTLGIQVEGLTSQVPRKKRKQVLEDFKSGSLPMLVATSLADEGLDIPRLSRIGLAFPQQARGGTMQRMGRLLRHFEGKRPKLIDFVDDEVPTLARRAEARRRVYRELGLLR